MTTMGPPQELPAPTGNNALAQGVRGARLGDIQTTPHSADHLGRHSRRLQPCLGFLDDGATDPKGPAAPDTGL